MEKKYIGKTGIQFRKTLIGIGQGYWQTSPMALFDDSPIANGGYEIKPRIVIDDEEKNKFENLDQSIADKKMFSDDETI